MNKPAFKKYMKQIAIPEGFTANMITVKENGNIPSTDIFIVKSDTVEIKFDQTGSGHTSFLHDGHWLCFDRRGVEDSFYWMDWNDKPEDCNAILAEQLEEITKSIEYMKKSISIPGIPFSTTKEKLVEQKKKLQQGGIVTFFPSGFGTGYRISTHGMAMGKPASKEMKNFFGVDKLCIVSFDAD